MIGLMPMPGGGDRGSYSVAHNITGSTGVTIPGDVDQGDYALILANGLAVGGTPSLTAPAGFTDISRASGSYNVTTTPVGNNGEERTTTYFWHGLVCGAPLTVAKRNQALSGIVGSADNYAGCRLLIIRNSAKRPSHLTLYPQGVTGAYPSTLIAYADQGAPVLAGFASVYRPDVSPLFNGAAFGNVFNDAYYANVAFNLQNPGQSGNVSCSAFGTSHRPFAISTI